MRLETVLGSRNRVRVLRALMRRDGVSGRMAGRLAGLSASPANVALTELVDAGFVLRSGTVGKHVYELNRHHCLWSAIERLFADEERVPLQAADLMRRHMNGMKPPRSLMGIGIRDDGVVVAVVKPQANATDPALASLRAALRAEFGFSLGEFLGDPPAQSFEGLWIAAASEQHRGRVIGGERARESTLNFFGLAKGRGK